MVNRRPLTPRITPSYTTKWLTYRDHRLCDVTSPMYTQGKVDYMTLNRATLNQRQLVGRQLTAATFNRND